MGALDVGGYQPRFQGCPRWPEGLALQEMFLFEPQDAPSIAVLRFRHIGDLERKATLVASAKQQIIYQIGML